MGGGRGFGKGKGKDSFDKGKGKGKKGFDKGKGKGFSGFNRGGRGGGRGGQGGHDDRRQNLTLRSDHLVKPRRGGSDGRGRGRGRGGFGALRDGSAGICFQFSKSGHCPRGASCSKQHVRNANRIAVVDRVDIEGLGRHCEKPDAHGAAITAIVMTPDGIYTASQDESLKRWKPERGADGRFALTCEVQVPLEDSCYSLLSHGTYLFCGLWDGRIKVFAKDGPESVLQGHTKRVNSMIIHMDILISGGGDSAVRLWKMDANRTWACTHTITESMPGSVHKLCAMGANLFIAGSCGLAMLNLQTLAITKIIPPVKFVADFLEYQGHLITGYSDGGVRVFDAEGNLKGEMQPSAAGPIICLAGLDSGPRVVCGHTRGQVSTIELTGFTLKTHFQAFEGGRVESIMCAGHDGIFMVGSQGGALQMWQRLDTPGI